MTLELLTYVVTFAVRSLYGAAGGKGSRTAATPLTGGVVGPHAGVKSAKPLLRGGSFSCAIGCPVVLSPRQLAVHGTRSTCSVPLVSIPTAARLSAAWCSTTPPCIRSPLGQPPFQLKKSPLTPIVVMRGETSRSIEVTVSRPVIVPFESNALRL